MNNNSNGILRTIKQSLYKNEAINRMTLPYRLYRPGKKIEQSSFDIKWDGNPLDGGKKFCLISERRKGVGLLEVWFALALKVLYASGMGYIPYLFYNADLRGTKNNKEFLDNLGENEWEFFFNQYQNEYNIEQVLFDKANYDILCNYFGFDGWLFGNPGGEALKLNKYRELYKIMGLRKEIENETYTIDIPSKTLGITIRREMEYGNRLGNPFFTGWRGHHTRGHIEKYASWIYDHLHKFGYNCFFLTTEDRETLDFFKREFGNQCINYNRRLYHYFKNNQPVDRQSPEILCEFEQSEGIEYRRKVCEEYLRETFLLSGCEAILWNYSAQHYMAYVMSKRGLSIIRNNLSIEMFG